jgi:hypothetical protein
MSRQPASAPGADDSDPSADHSVRSSPESPAPAQATAPAEADSASPPASASLPASPASAEAEIPQLPIIARAAGYYRLTRYIMVVAVVVCGLWFARDGYVKWPRENQEYREARSHHLDSVSPELRHSEMDIQIQKALGWGLPPLALLILAWSLYRSRGAYRLDERGLSVPGQPLIEPDRIAALDMSRWETKRIAIIRYIRPDGSTGRAKLDDFVYQEKPTGQIVKLVQAHYALTHPDEAAAAAADAGGEPSADAEAR